MEDIHKQTMSNGAITVPADSFHQKTDMNIEPTPVNVQLGSIPKHWTNSEPISKRDLQTIAKYPVTGESINQSKVLRFAEFESANK